MRDVFDISLVELSSTYIGGLMRPIHKTLVNDNIAMCGACVPNIYKSRRWADCSCIDCWKHAKDYVKRRYADAYKKAVRPGETRGNNG